MSPEEDGTRDAVDNEPKHYHLSYSGPLDLGSVPALPVAFQGRFTSVTSKLALQCLTCQAPGVVGSALGLVGLVSVYCVWVRLHWTEAVYSEPICMRCRVNRILIGQNGKQSWEKII